MHWALELTSHFQAHYLFALALCCLGLLLFCDWRWSLVAGTGVIIAGIAVVPWYFGRPGTPPGGTPLRILLSNVYTPNTQSGPVLELTRTERIDVAVLQEIDDRWLRDLEPMRELLPYKHALPRADNFGIGVWSRLPFSEVRELESELAEVPSISGLLDVGGRRVMIIATHPVPPGSSDGAKARNAQLAELAAIAAGSSAPVILIGDLNVTMWSPFYRRFEKVSGLRNARKGFGILPSWPAQLCGLGIPLDHCLVSPTLHVTNVRHGSPVGSDHLPLIVELVVPSGN